MSSRAALGVLALAAVGCGAVLGIEEGHPRSGDGAAGTGGGSAGMAGASAGAAGAGGASAGVAGAGGVNAGAGGAALPGVPELVFLRQHGSSGNDTASDLCTDSADALYVAGRVGGAFTVGGSPLSAEASGETRYVVRYDADGAHSWSLRLAADEVTINQLLGSSEGGVYLVGVASGPMRVLDAPLSPDFVAPSTDVSGAFVLRIDLDGVARWLRRFEGAPGRALTGKAAAEVGEEVMFTGVFGGALTLDGFALNTGADDDVYVARLDRSTGQVLGARRVGTPGDDAFPQLAARADGALLALACDGPLDGAPSPVDCPGLALVELEPTLGLRRARGFDVDAVAQVMLAASPQGDGYLVARFSGGASLAPLPALEPGANRTLIARFGAELIPLAARLAPNPGASALGAVAVDVDGGALLGGWVRGCLTTSTGALACTAPAGAQNGLTLKLTPTLEIAWFGVQRASVTSTNGVVTSLAVTPSGAVLGASNFSDSVLVGATGASATSLGGVDGLVGRFE